MEVYYTSTKHELIEEPDSALNWFVDQNKDRGIFEDQPILKCPAFTDRLKNIFVIRSNYDYTFTWTGKEFHTTMYDEAFFEKSIFIRSMKNGWITIRFPYIMFCCEQDLLMETSLPFLDNTPLKEKSVIIPGEYNVGRRFRHLETTFLLKEPCTIQIRENDPLYYVKFYTKEKIKFRKFYYSLEMKEFEDSYNNKRDLTLKNKSLQYWYDIFTNSGDRKFFLKHIKRNLM